VVAFLTLMVLPLTLWRERGSGRKWITGVVILTLSYPAVRTIVDGNVEFLILAGMILLEFGLVRKNPVLLGLGILLAATKVQETWILLIFLPWLIRKEWNLRMELAAAGVIAWVGIPAMLWKGWDWLQSLITSQYRGSIMDSSLLTNVQRLGGKPGLAFLCWIFIMGG
jgi:uncharacterized membrane protein